MLPVEREHIGNKLHISRLVVQRPFCFRPVGMVRRERRKGKRKGGRQDAGVKPEVSEAMSEAIGSVPQSLEVSEVFLHSLFPNYQGVHRSTKALTFLVKTS